MSFIEWQSAYEIGIPKVDEQHRELVAIINELEMVAHSRNTEEVVEAVVVKLVDYIRYHFAEEEKLMAENQYAETDKHAVMHQVFVQKIASVLRKLKNNSNVQVQDILPFLKSWLINHILREDSKLRSLYHPNMIG